MKKFLPIYILVLAFCCWQCQLEETNINPNVPTAVPLETLLPPAEQSIADIMGGDAAVIAGIFSQYFVGVDGLVAPLDKYSIDDAFFMRPVWADFYTSAMSTLNLIILQSTQEDAPHYRGLAKTLQALCLGTASSLWGDIPYTEAFQGVENLSPNYDDQADIYRFVQTLLEEAIVDLQAENSVFSPGEDDLFFAGDLEQWIKVAYTLQARFALHTIKRDPGAALTALDALAQGIQEESNGLVYTYNTLEINPWSQYFTATPNIQVDPYFQDLLSPDPRYNTMVKSTFGSLFPDDAYTDPAAPLFIVPFFEAEFLRAEALARTGGNGAEEALRSAISAHFTAIQVDIAETDLQAFLDTTVVLSGNPEEDLALILTQKYIAQFISIESWTDFRRTGFPQLPANEGGNSVENPNGEIPRRFPYPINEVLYNPNTPLPLPDLQERMWWDQ
ncbi:MAG: SusD/RagB family nutrient-binding outer membrane lipoprotein [Bacteroidota bacterium]